MAKKAIGKIKLQIMPGKANPAPPIGPALGQRGLNIMEFCKAFNAQTQNDSAGLILPVKIVAYADRTFTFEIGTPPVSALLKKAAKIDKGSTETGKKAHVGSVDWSQIEEIAKIKMKDMNANDIKGASEMIAGTAMSMGLLVNREGA